MADATRRRPENAAGEFYVDSTCIDCDLCRWVAPLNFAARGEQSAVVAQPRDADERGQALHALLSCPTASIGTMKPAPDIRQAQEDFPLPVDGDVFFCGYASEASFGAASYIVRRESGNILIDSPRFAAPLVRRLEALGGVKLLFLTHRDDVADHAKFAAHFGCERIMLRGDIDAGTRDVERPLDGGAAVEIAPDALVIPTPGHTEGHGVLLIDKRYLFTGDHLAWSPERNRLYAFSRHCWYSWRAQIESMKRLRAYEFEWVLPGHGRRFQAADAETMRRELELCIEWMERQQSRAL